MTTFTIPTLQTARLTLRPYQVSDFPAYFALMSSDRARYMGGPVGQSDAWAWFTNDTANWQFFGFGTLAIEIDQDLAGFVGLIQPPNFPEAECGWGLYDGFTGKGIATEAARAMLDHSFATTGLASIVSYIAPDNTASQKVANRLGATVDATATSPFGKDGLVYRHVPQGAAA